MALVRFLWLRRLIRRHTNPMQEDNAQKWQRRLSYTYAILAWQTLGIVGYLMYQGKADWAAYYGLKSEEEIAASPAKQWSQTLGIKKATVYRVSGLNVSTYEIDNDAESKTNGTDTGLQS